MTKNIILIYLICLCGNSFSQKISTDGEVRLQYLEAYVFNEEKFDSCGILYTTPEDYYSYKVEYLIESVEKEEPIDVNKYSIVDEENNIRYRPVCVRSNYPRKKVKSRRRNLKSSLKLLTEDCISKFWGAPMGYAYLPEYKDSFYDYDFSDCKLDEVRLNYVLRKKKGTTSYYFRPRDEDRLHVEFTFAFHKRIKNSNLKLYYGKEKIRDLQFSVAKK